MAVLSLAASSSWALGLGRLNVQSALGENLRAEIDIASLSPEEEGSLKVRVAPPDSYRSTGIEYNQVLTTAQVQLSRRANGQPYLRISSDRAVQEPFIDVILEINWSNGRLVREYTLLFDPPNLRTPAPPAVATAPVLSPAPAPLAKAPAAPAPVAPVALRPVPAKPAPPPVVAAQKPALAAPKPLVDAAAAPAPKPAAVSRTASDYAVRRGDSLSRIASRTRPPEVSLDQMLVSLFRANPDAFIESNMNLLKAGSVLRLPSSDAATSISNDEARQIVRAQSADFEGYRQRLASGAPLVAHKDSERQSVGKVQAAVVDGSRATPSPDKLVLSKAGAVPVDEKASKETEKKDSVARVAELTRNVEELKKLSSVAARAASPESASAPASATMAPTVALDAAVPAAAASGASQAVAAASKPVAKVPVRVAPVEEPGLLSELMDSPLVLPLSGVLIALLGGLGLYRLRARSSSKTAGETGFRDSRLQPDSFFGATGGQRVDTRDGSGQASTMSYSLSQLDAIGDVDPVAEADVYLAYGRDLQAEEILKEALRATPERRAIRMKLLEVYAKRRDTKGFEQLATQMYVETHGEGEDWLKTQELGLQIDPDNTLYQPGGAPAAAATLDGLQDRLPLGASTMPQSVMPGMSMFDTALDAPDTQASEDFASSGMDLDLDLDAPVAPDSSMEATQAMTVSVERSPMEMDFDLSAPPGDELDQRVAAHKESAAMDFDLSLPLGDETEPSPPARHEPAAMEFDLSSINLDLGTPSVGPTTHAGERLPDFGSELDLHEANDDDGDPLARKIELADEFRQIGDVEGARDVLLEVIDKASGAMRERAQAMLKEIS